MKKIVNNIIPFNNYKALTMWPLLFVRKNANFSPVDERHEEIHGRQQMELLIVLFYLLYGIFYLICLIRCRNHKEAYRNNPFEAEAYLNERKTTYLEKRHLYAWTKYIGKTTFKTA